jgi:hypothetical protein
MAHYTRNHAAGASLHADPFEDDVRDRPFDPYDEMPRDDTMTFTTTTSGIPAPTPFLPSAGRTEAQSVISNYRRTSSPSPPLPGMTSREPTPSLSERNDLAIPYKDEDSYSTLRPSSVVGKSDAALVHNAADMGRTDSYQDLGMSFDHGGINSDLNFLEYAEPSGAQSKLDTENASPFQKALGMNMGKYPMEQRIEDKKRGIGRQKYPFVGG